MKKDGEGGIQAEAIKTAYEISGTTLNYSFGRFDDCHE